MAGLTDRSCSRFWHGERADGCGVARSGCSDGNLDVEWRSAVEGGRRGHFLVRKRPLEITMRSDGFVVRIVIDVATQ